VIQTCKQCGAINEGHAETCCFCDARLAPDQPAPAAPGRSAPTEGNLAVEVDWRREVVHRLEAYRARRRRLRPNESQAALPFCPEGGDSEASELDAADARSEGEDAARFAAAHDLAPERRESDRISHVERVEINVTQPDVDLAGAEDRPFSRRPEVGAASGAPLLPVAALDERRRAGLLDATFLLLAYGGFLTLFGSLGGHFSFGKSDAAVYLATLVLFYAQYFALFTFFGGATPGMLLRGLRVVSFDGGAPTAPQLLWRSFGYLVSGGTVFLGFLWALWDEDHLTWQDRISQTYLTSAESAGEHEAIAAPQDTHDLARK
jgi:uncharacterized RDD family membrane protein YckC